MGYDQCGGYNRGKGKAFEWLLSQIGHQGDGCLKWPFCIDKTTGRGQFGYKGKHYKAHRFMCVLAHGEPPTPKHQAAHNCGKGHESCVNPRHLEWKTGSQNQIDRDRHGTKACPPKYKNRLSPIQVDNIRLLKGIKTMREVADIFGVSDTTVGDIWRGRIWNRAPKTSVWTPAEDAIIRDSAAKGLTYEQMLERLPGRTPKAMMTRVYRLRAIERSDAA